MVTYPSVIQGEHVTSIVGCAGSELVCKCSTKIAFSHWEGNQKSPSFPPQLPATTVFQTIQLTQKKISRCWRDCSPCARMHDLFPQSQSAGTSTSTKPNFLTFLLGLAHLIHKCKVLVWDPHPQSIPSLQKQKRSLHLLPTSRIKKTDL